MPDLEDAVDALREVMLASEEFRTSVAVRHGIGVRETEAISYLRARGPMSQHALGLALHLTPGSVTALVDRLESRDLATRQPSPTDRRVTLVTLTQLANDNAEEGRAALIRCFEATPRSSDPDVVRVLYGLATALREQA